MFYVSCLYIVNINFQFKIIFWIPFISISYFKFFWEIIISIEFKFSSIILLEIHDFDILGKLFVPWILYILLIYALLLFILSIIKYC